MITASNGQQFVLRDIVSLSMRAWYKRITLALDEARIGVDDLSLLQLAEFICEDAERLRDCMTVAYRGDHSTVDWFADEDSTETVKAVLSFLADTLARTPSSESVSETSLQPTPETLTTEG